ncbi:uncharacterized protein NEPG_02129 [Nematocida parisii ERTm1]|uniref:uncharacterized protein n=1 Tax=Nematocida parisii (strain ERTm1 / ATCC PRA-289) TaxID=881290 RepID=UPI000264B23D|nr:uncharacterized protein NEPG_02129 [Nematocida parisii ERTm1]EIJ93173.1 hypothetical protein NEPG_02129 [Nematocida parisii ERTm1]KAI5145859.1 hemolysin III [Nematocida parisii]|eukprot:XP_013059956.1 hypothetical protein NEPG_02129 [Nematocida parisii ERTm1]
MNIETISKEKERSIEQILTPNKSNSIIGAKDNPNVNENIDQEDSSSGYFTYPNSKPYCRGRIHQVAFYLTIIMYIVLMCTLRINKIYLSLYFASQVLLYGISGTYHTKKWKTRESEKLFQKLDHSSIFLLIAGTQTCVIAAINEVNIGGTSNILLYLPISYILAILGMLKVFFIQNIPKSVNVSYYIVHGASVIIFVPIEYVKKELPLFVFSIFGGVSYIIGGIIYGTKKPDPWPKTFGFHEIFHTLTVIGNTFFMLTIVWADYKAGRMIG